jgi:septum formation protein
MQQQPTKRKLILASSSPYRRQLLSRLGIPFETHAPTIDESALPGEHPAQLAGRLAREKAEVLASRFPQAVVIGSDQVAVHRGRIVGKAGTAAGACRQLADFSGESVEFLTAVCVRCRESGLCREDTVGTRVAFRPLNDDEIRRYVGLDQPTDCAGSFKSEAAGPMLLRAMHSSDPTAIIGLPLITVAEALRAAGFDLP